MTDSQESKKPDMRFLFTFFFVAFFTFHALYVQNSEPDEAVFDSLDSSAFFAHLPNATWAQIVQDILKQRGPSSMLVLDFDDYDARFEDWNARGRTVHYSLLSYKSEPVTEPLLARREIYNSWFCPRAECWFYVLRSCFDVIVINYPSWELSTSHPWHKILMDTLQSPKCQGRRMDWIFVGKTCDAEDSLVAGSVAGHYSSSTVCHRVCGPLDESHLSTLDWGTSPNVFLVWTGTDSLTQVARAALHALLTHNPHSPISIYSNTLALNVTDDKRITVRRFDMAALVADTPAAPWYHSGILNQSVFFRQNIANCLRLVLLYRTGGVYLDFDVIVLTSLRYTKNTLGIQSDSLNSAVLSFEQGHPFLWECMENFVANFQGNIWANNGPGVVSRVFPETRVDVTLMGSISYYPVPFRDTKGLFRAVVATNSTTLTRLRRQAIGVHLWMGYALKKHMTVGAHSLLTHITHERFDLEHHPLSR